VTPKRRTREPSGEIVATARRVVLRRPRWEDEDEMLALRRASAEFLRRWEPDMPGVDPLGHSWYARYMRFGDEHARFRLLVCSRRSGRIWGSVSVGEIERAKRTATLGYWIGARHAKHGYMTEAILALLRDVLPSESIETIQAFVLPENLASKRLLEKCGFRREGTAPQYRVLRGEPRDHERWFARLTP
jgi:ribosomal-protein-alanine N-acetyltransferase